MSGDDVQNNQQASAESQSSESQEKSSGWLLKTILTVVLWVVALVVIVPGVLGFVGGSWWMDTLADFRIIYAELLLVLVILTVIFRRWLLAAVCVVLLVLNVLPMLPTLNSNVVKPTAQAPQVKALLMNVAHKYNQNEYQPSVQLVETEKPQIVLLQEVDSGWLTEFYDMVREDYDMVTDMPRGDHYGIAMLVRTVGENKIQVEKAKSELADKSKQLLHIPQVEAVVRAAGSEQDVYFYGIRTRPPMNKQRCDATKFILDKAAQRLANQPADMPKVVLGDVNHTPWSSFIQNFIEETGLTVNSGAYGLQPSYPASWPRFMRLPIDMIFFNEYINLYECRLGPDIGSTHLPLIVTFGPTVHQQRKSQGGIDGLIRSAEQTVEKQVDRVKDAADMDETQTSQ